MKRLYFLFFTFLIVINVVGQDIKQTAADYATDLYINSMGKQSGLYNGIEYAVFPYVLNGYVFFETPGASIGYVLYDGVRYDAKLLYDLVSDVLVVNNDTCFIQLHSDIIDQFSIRGRQFVRIARDSASLWGLTPGFYDLLYNGKLKVLGRYSKNIQEEEIMNEKQHVVHSKQSYYLRMGDKFRSADNERLVINALKDKGKEISEFIKKNNINFKANKEAALTSIAAYYEQLKN